MKSFDSRGSPAVARGGLAAALAALVIAVPVTPAASKNMRDVGVPATRSAGAGGSELWEARWDGPAGRSDYPTDMVVDPAGERVFVTGSSADPVNDLQYVTVGYVAGTGQQLWVSRLNEYYSEGFRIAVSPDGTRVFVTGGLNAGSGNSDWGTVAYDAATGAQLWLARYDRGSGDIARDVAVSPDGSRVFVTGYASAAAPEDYATIAYDETTGTQLWSAFYDGPAAFSDQAVAVRVAPDGTRLYVTGWSCGGDTGNDYATVAYDPFDGTQLWVARYTGPKADTCPGIGDRPASMAVSSDGADLYVTGSSPGRYANGDVTTVAYDAATGTQRWVRRYNAPHPDIFSGGVGVGVNPSGTRVFVAGSVPGDQSDFVTIAYSTKGRQLWASTYDGPGNDIDVARTLVVGPTGAQVYIAGRSASGTSDDYATLAYNARRGAQVWLARYNGPGNGYDWPTALAVRPNGSAVYVTGNSLGTTSDDYLTVAYQA